MKMKISFLDIEEHGDCSVILFDEKAKQACIVVDGGEGKNGCNALTNHLKKNKVDAIDLLVCTHLDADHINGLKLFAKSQLDLKQKGKAHIAVRHYWGPMPRTDSAFRDLADVEQSGTGGPALEARQFVMTSVAQNEELLESLSQLVPQGNIRHPSREDLPPKIFANVKIDILSPREQVSASLFEKQAFGFGGDFAEGATLNEGDDLSKLTQAVHAKIAALAEKAKTSINNQSIVFALTPMDSGKPADKFKFLFPGDAENDVWDDLASDKTYGKLLEAHVLKIPHHGSKNGISPAGVLKVRPEYAVNMVGQKHGIPDEEPLRELQKAGAKLICTQRNRDAKQKSACFGVKGNECPVCGPSDSSDVVFGLDLGAGKLSLLSGRACKHSF